MNSCANRTTPKGIGKSINKYNVPDIYIHTLGTYFSENQKRMARLKMPTNLPKMNPIESQLESITGRTH